MVFQRQGVFISYTGNHGRSHAMSSSLLYTVLNRIFFLHFARVVDDAKCTVITRVCVSVCVCLSVRGRTPTLLHGPGCNLGRGRGCPLVVHNWADLQSVHGLRCYGKIMRTLVTSLRPSRDMTKQCERAAGSARAAGR